MSAASGLAARAFVIAPRGGVVAIVHRQRAEVVVHRLQPAAGVVPPQGALEGGARLGAYGRPAGRRCRGCAPPCPTRGCSLRCPPERDVVVPDRVAPHRAAPAGEQQRPPRRPCRPQRGARACRRPNAGGDDRRPTGRTQPRADRGSAPPAARRGSSTRWPATAPSVRSDPARTAASRAQARVRGSERPSAPNQRQGPSTRPPDDSRTKPAAPPPTAAVRRRCGRCRR